MLFAVTYAWHPGRSEHEQKRALQLFTSWQPPFEFKAHYATADGGIAVVETESAAAVVEGIAPWTPFFRFDVKPALEVEQAVPIYQKAYDWRDSVA